MTPRHVLVAVAWPYATGPRHLGHLGGCYLPADIFARYHRMAGSEVLMVSGSDSHGTPITVAAEEEGVTPRDIVERYHQIFLDQWDRVGISFDLFTTTMTDNHHAVTQNVFRRLHEAGYIDARTTEQFYDPQVERFLPDRYVEGTCPHCDYDGARGDQCDNCGRTLDPIDLVDPRSKLSGATPEPRDTTHWFLLLSELQDDIESWLEGREGWRPHVVNWALGFVRGGLHDRAITRDLDWGVPIPEEFDTIGEGKRIYVWFDAVIGYLSAAMEWAATTDDPEAWRRWWQDEGAESYYFIGKDNIPFHAVQWPAYLIGMNSLGGEQLHLPTDVPANQFVTFKGEKASSSRGIGTPIEDFLDIFTVDQLRYAVAAVIPEMQDTDISEDDLRRRANEELGNGWGNLVNRVFAMVAKNFDGVVPAPGELASDDRELLAGLDTHLGAAAEAIENVQLRAGLKEAMAIAQDTNAYLNAMAPWKTAKTDSERTATTLWVALQAIDAAKQAFAPYVPFSSERIHGWLGHEGDPTTQGWARAEVPAGRSLGETEVLFPRIDPPADGAA